jgi:nicotinamide mononucleotide transporter
VRVSADWYKELGALEWAAVSTTLVNVWLTIRADIRNFIFGIVAVVLYGILFWQQKLYANMALQFAYYLPMQAVGWWIWLRTGPKKDDDLPIRRLSWRSRCWWLLGTGWTTVLVGWALAKFTDGHIPYLDAGTTAASIVGQYLLTRKWVENWAFWIGVDIVYVGWVFPCQKLWLSTGLYFVLLVMSAIGLRAWLRAEKKGLVHA